MTIPFLWPRGTYGLPKPKSGCPKEEKGSGFVWHEGSRYHDTPTFFPVNEWSNPYDLAGFYGKENVQPYFCIKTQQGSSKFSLPWPKGKYCILKKGKCPSGKNLLIKVISNMNYWAPPGVWKGRIVERGEFRGFEEATEEVLLLKLTWLLSFSKRMRLFPFHKWSLQVLTIYVTIGNQAFSHGRLNIFSRFKLKKYVEIHFLIFK